MGQFFRTIYCWLDGLFGHDLASYLGGHASPHQTGDLFLWIGLSMVLISLVVMWLYYYAIDHPRLAYWWGWLIFLGGNALINFLVGWQWVLVHHYEAGKMVAVDPVSNMETPLPIGKGDIVGFGVANLLLSVLAFVVLSYAFRWISTSSRHAPFF